MKITTIKKIAVISLLALFANASIANAAEENTAVKTAESKEESKSLNIAILDIENILKNSVVMKDIQSKITKKQTEFQKDIDKRQAQLQEEDKKLNSKRSSISKEAFEKEQIEFEKKVVALKDTLEKKQNSLKKASLDAMAQIQDKIKDIIADISKEKNLDLVIPSSQVLYAKDGMDISPEVLKRLNKKITKIDVKFD